MKTIKLNKLSIALLIVSLGAVSLQAKSLDIDTPEDNILAKGFEAFMDGKDKIALSYFEEVIRINPKNQAAVRGLERVQERLKKKKDAEEKRNLNYAQAKVREGQELLKTNDLVSAVDAYHAALARVPGHKPADKALKKMRKKMNKILKSKKFNLSTWAFARGVLAYMDRDWAKAYRIWSQRAQIERSNVALQQARKRAEAKFVKMMMSEREEFLRRGGRAFYRQGLYHEAKKAWSKILAFRDEDLEALEGLARSEQALLKIQGKNRDKRAHDLLEKGLRYYAGQSYVKARDTFKQLVSIDPDFKTAKEYLTKINRKLSAQQYRPVAQKETASWRQFQPSNQGKKKVVDMPDTLENLEARRAELESQLKRNPTDITIQQQLDRMKSLQDGESERIYKDGLIAYSQGNRSLAIDKWKQVLLVNPNHKKAAAALRKARAEEERVAEDN